MIHIDTLSKTFSGGKGLDRVSLHIKPGEMVALIGSSGSGKSTLMRHIAGLMPGDADGGRIEVAQHLIQDRGVISRDIRTMRAEIGMVFQQFNLFRNKNVLENITEGLIYGYGKTKKEAEEIAMEELARVRMTDYAHMYPSELSGGMQQRVGIARALAPKPDVILFDEPTSALDPELVGEVLDTIASVATLGITMIIVTHEMHFAQDISTKAVFMSDGLIVEEGHPKEFFSHPKEEQTRAFLRRMLKREEA